MKQWLLIGFIMLTGLQGQHVWLAANQIVSVREPVAGRPAEYPEGCNSVVTTMSNTFCVEEQPADIVSKLEKAS